MSLNWIKVMKLFIALQIKCMASMEAIDSLAESEMNLKRSVLTHLNLKEFPRFSGEEFDSFQIPQSAKTRYDVAMQKSRLPTGNSNLNRKRRSKGPSLATLFKKVHKNSSIYGSFVYSSTFREKLQFDMEGKVPERSRISVAQLRLYKKLPNFNRRLPSDSRSSLSQSTNRRRQRQRPTARWRSDPVRHARVSIYHTLIHADGAERSKLIDSRMIFVNGSGWQSFDVTRAVRQWQKHPVKYMSITLELRVEGSRPGRAAAEIARMVRFTGQKASTKSPRRPELVVFTEEEKLNANDCASSKSRGGKGRCCRRHRYVNFRKMAWAQNWIIEPKGYDAFECVGRCSASKRKTSPGAARSCAASETAPLAVMYLVRRGEETHVEVTEFPNMIVKRCGCSLDSLYVV